MNIKGDHGAAQTGHNGKGRYFQVDVLVDSFLNHHYPQLMNEMV